MPAAAPSRKSPAAPSRKASAKPATPAKSPASRAKGAEAPAPAKAKPRATTATVRAAPKAKPAAAPKRAPPKRARAPKADPNRLERLVEAARKSLDDDKAVDIVVLDVTNRASYADRLIIATGLVGRQIEAMATHVDDALAKEGMHLRRSAFSKSEEWVLIDAGDLVIHLFTPEARLKFDLEKMWGPDSPMGEAAPGEQSPI
jgi:ribosome silencing factor RsfS/YbeB/iojap